MTATVKMFLLATSDFFMTLGATVTGAMLQQGQVILPSKGVWILGILVGGAAFWGSVKSSLSAPPT